MKASELIAELQAIVAEHGDVDVESPDPGCGCCAGGDPTPDVSYRPERVEKVGRREYTWPAHILIEGGH